MTTRAYYNHLQLLRRYTGMMPGDQPLPTDAEIENAYFYAQHPHWRSTFLQNYDFPTQVTMATLLSYTERLERTNPWRPNLATRDNGSHKQHNHNYNDDTSDSTTSADDASHDSRNNNNNNHTNNPSTTRYRPRTYQCPHHGSRSNHPWADCVFNIQSANYAPDAVQRYLAKRPRPSGPKSPSTPASTVQAHTTLDSTGVPSDARSRDIPYTQVTWP